MSGSGPASSQPLGKLLAQGLTEAGVRKQPRQTRPRLRSWAVPQFPYSAPGAGLGYKWGCGKGSGPGLWPSNPQKALAPQSPGRDLPAWWHKGVPRGGREVLPEETLFKGKG